jgi:hypothetical protein
MAIKYFFRKEILIVNFNIIYYYSKNLKMEVIPQKNKNIILLV